MALTYEPIATYTANGSQSAITFSSIPSTYTDLYLICNVSYASLGANTGYLLFQIGNGSVNTSTIYSYTWLVAGASAGASGKGTGAPYFDGLTNITGTNNGIVRFNLNNYANTTTNKTALYRVDDSRPLEAVGLCRSTAAVNTLKVYDYSGYNFSSTSTFTLYGIKAA